MNQGRAENILRVRSRCIHHHKYFIITIVTQVSLGTQLEVFLTIRVSNTVSYEANKNTGQKVN